MRRFGTDEWLDKLQGHLSAHEAGVNKDPQTNPIKLLAYDASMAIEERSLAFRDIEAIVKSLSDEGAIRRIKRLSARAGVERFDAFEADIIALAKQKAAEGFEAYQGWAGTALQGIVLTAHPTFSLSRPIRETLGEIASDPASDNNAQVEKLKTLPFLQIAAPTLQEEHADAQAAITRLQDAIHDLNIHILGTARENFPERWSEITPCLIKVYSWVGYDIDGRTDIGWADAIRLRLQEKHAQLMRYSAAAAGIQKKCALPDLAALCEKLANAVESTKRDLELFNADLSDPENLILAANNLTRESDRRILSTSGLYGLLEAAISAAPDAEKLDLVLLKAELRNFGLGTARIHFRLNARHVVNGVRAAFGMKSDSSDARTLLQRASEMTRKAEAKQVNFAALELETNTAHQQMMLAAQIHKYIDAETPIRLLIAECEDSLMPLGMLYLARLYGLEKHLDISPLFETAEALNNGGRIISKMLANPVYRDYIKTRGVFAIQTGFSDAGRFMGQLPATLSIERLQSHFAAALAEHGIEDVQAIVFNTHGESCGRGGHPGTLADRLDYVMSPWAMRQFEKRGLPLCHETSFQGGDGFMWFQTPTLAKASVFSIALSRYAQNDSAEDDPFYSDRDFSWDVFRTLSAEQERLYNNPNYLNLLGSFGQNLLIPTGSRAAKRASSENAPHAFDPRQLRAIPHNAILQQFGAPANIFHGTGRAGCVDRERFLALLQNSARAKSIFGLAFKARSRANLSALTAYGRLFDPGFWISRALSGNEPLLAERSLIVARSLTNHDWRAKITALADRLRIDVFEAMPVSDFMPPEGDQAQDIDRLKILHALRIAVIMKMLILASDLPTYGQAGTSNLDVLQRLQGFQIDAVLADLRQRFPSSSADLDWTDKLTEPTDVMSAPVSAPHMVETVIKPLARAAQLVRQITIAITHSYDAYG